MPATACPDDGYQCTSDLCDGKGVCRHAQRSGPCDDGDPCTSNDSCFGGSCSGGTPVTCAPCLSCDGVLGCVPTLDTHCKQAGKSSIKLRDVKTERVTWKWLRGDHTSPQDLGNPQLATDYAFCTYDGTVDVNGNPGLLLGARVPAGFSWKAKGSSFVYLAPDVIQVIRLRPGDDSKAKVLVKGKGSTLNLSPLQWIVLPVTVQLKGGNGLACWKAEYNSATSSNERLFKAQSP